MQAVYMTPRSTFPETFPSNTLFGAICWAWMNWGKDVGALVGAYAEKPPFFISSCFPYLHRKNPVPLYPMPMLPHKDIPANDYDTMKKLKKVRWIDEGILRRLCEGSLTVPGIIRNWDTFGYSPKMGLLASTKDALVTNDRDNDFFEDVDIPHNQINRRTTASEKFFHTSGTHYKDSGLWFLMEFSDSSWEKSVLAALRLLADEGIGPRRSSGQGSFSLSFGSSSIPAGRDAPFLMTLSRLLPDSLSPFGREIWYDLVTIRGRSQDGVAKKKVLMLSEGTFFKNTGKPWYGRIACVREEPPMVEFGVAFPIGMRCLA